jgi:hypothetical protein
MGQLVPRKIVSRHYIKSADWKLGGRRSAVSNDSGATEIAA